MYLLNSEIKDKKKIKVALKDIYGIGYTKAERLCQEFGISEKTTFSQLSSEKINSIINYIEKKYPYGSLLKEKSKKDIKALAQLKTVRGIRHRNKLPVRGQRTHTNGKTKKRN